MLGSDWLNIALKANWSFGGHWSAKEGGKHPEAQQDITVTSHDPSGTISWWKGTSMTTEAGFLVQPTLWNGSKCKTRQLDSDWSRAQIWLIQLWGDTEGSRWRHSTWKLSQTSSPVYWELRAGTHLKVTPEDFLGKCLIPAKSPEFDLTETHQNVIKTVEPLSEPTREEHMRENTSTTSLKEPECPLRPSRAAQNE